MNDEIKTTREQRLRRAHVILTGARRELAIAQTMRDCAERYLADAEAELVAAVNAMFEAGDFDDGGTT